MKRSAVPAPLEANELLETARPTLAIQREILAELRLMRSAIDRLGPRSTLTRDDRRRLEQIVRAAVPTVGDAAFSAADLREVPAVVGLGLSTMQVGRLFARAERAGVLLDGRVLVERVGCERNTALWRLVRPEALVSGISNG